MNNFDLKNIECFVFDTDGTIYLGNKLIDGAKELFNYFDKNNIKYYFLTNNSSKTSKLYFKKLFRLGINNIKEDQIITSGDITIDYIKKIKKNPRIYLVGTKELEGQFRTSGIKLTVEMNENIDFVVVGFDTSFEYRKAMIACKYISKGVPFIATNKDIKCPIGDEEFIPDCGSIVKMIEAVTGINPKFIGKPSKESADYLLNKANVPKDKIAIVGDRLYTDIAMGFNNGICSILVLSGETKLIDLETYEIAPDFVFNSIKDIFKELYIFKK